MDLNDLINGHSVERPKGTPTLTPDAVKSMLPLVPGWELSDDGKSLQWRHRFADFLSSIDALNKVAALAEQEQHHPDIRVYSYRWLELTFSTHSIGGLSDNDFIMAAKTNQLLEL